VERVERTINGASARRRESYESRIAPHSGRTVDLDACGGLRGASILSLLVGDPAYAHNQLRQDLWRAGHAHAGVLLILSLVTLRYVDEANLSKGMKRVVRH
jgi:hypothetical protein